MKRGGNARRVRRVLACAALAELCGVALAGLGIAPAMPCLALGCLFALAGLVRALRGRGALFCALPAMLLLGCGLAGGALSLRDMPTEPGVRLTGRVKAIVSDTRVILSDVTVDGETRLRRPAAATLMVEAGEARERVRVGQWIEGTGRLFAQSGPRNPGETDARVRALCDGYDLSGYILPGWTARGEASPLQVIYAAREALLSRMERTFGEHAALYQAVLLGERGGMEADVVRSMRLTGTAHILTVSGLHMSLIAAALDAALRRLRGRGKKTAVKAAALAAFACLTGCAPGTVRALIMALMRDLAALRGRRYDPLTALAAAALLMALVNPVWPLDGSFQFSFFVVLGLLLVNGRVQALLRRATPERLREPLYPLTGALAVCVSAQLAALPMQLRFYGYMPLLALPMNLLGGVLTPYFMAVGALCTAVGAVYAPLGTALAGVLGAPGAAFERASVALAGMDGAILRLPSPYALWVLLAAALMALCSGQILWSRRMRRLRPVAALALLLLYLPRFCPAARYVQLDVGQGDAAVIRRGNAAVLVDVGPEDSYAALRYLRHEGLRVELAILSHLDEDHAGALLTLLASEVDIPQIAMPVGAEEDVASHAVMDALALAREKGVPVLALEAGDSVEALGARFDVLGPSEGLRGSNERSLVLCAELEGVRILTTGDLPEESEPETLPDCDVLKVAHHGSRYATSPRLLEQTTPQAAIISVGANSYGHPTERVLDDLTRVGARILRTDELGCITLWLREGAWRARTFISPS